MKKVLFVDDESVNLFIFKVSFKDHYEVLTAESGKEALDILSTTVDINAVFSDLRMPEMDGLEFIAKAKHIKPGIRYNLISGFQLSEEIEAAIKSGLLNRYFSKPFNKQEIINEIENGSITILGSQDLV